MDYYFGDQLRWTYGFDNPNKAAALIASMLPLLWLLVAGPFSIRKQVVKWLCLAAGSAVFCAGWWLIFKTYSRGGLLAAGVGCLFAVMSPLYHRWRLPMGMRPVRSRTRWLMAASLCVVIAALFVSTRAAERSVAWVGQHEGSVDNRLALWQGGLRMIAENPWGVGAGSSGRAYMQWYEPLDLTAGYRTMVNSFLTYLVERGLAVFGLTILAAAILWTLTGPGKKRETMPIVAGALRGSIVAFAVAGYFSTTMENPWLWIPPGVSLFVLLTLRVRRARIAAKMPLRPGASARPSLLMVHPPAFILYPLAFILSLYVAGLLLDRNQPLTIHLSADPDAPVEVTVRGEPGARELTVYPDSAVLGPDYGKLLRKLALDTHTSIRLINGTGVVAGGPAMLVGAAASRIHVEKGSVLILVAPGRMDEDGARQLLRDAKRVILLLPSYDEDGRVAFWQDSAAALASSRLHQRILEGVGVEVDWAWDCVIQECSAQTLTNPNPT